MAYSSNDTLMAFYCIKTIYMVVTIVGQSWLLYIGSPLSTTEEEEMVCEPIRTVLSFFENHESHSEKKYTMKIELNIKKCCLHV